MGEPMKPYCSMSFHPTFFRELVELDLIDDTPALFYNPRGTRRRLFKIYWGKVINESKGVPHN